MKGKRVIAPAVVAAISCAFAAATCAVLVSSDKTANAETFSYDFFEYSGCYAETNVAVPTATGIANPRRGLAISAGASGAEARLKTDVSGEFDLEFLPYSATAYGGSDYESTTYDNSYQDIRTMSLVFTDAADPANTFTVRLNGGADGNNVTVNASVVANDTAAGVYYYKDNAAYGSTAGNNANGVYTFLYGSSFSNVAVAAGTYASKNVKPVRIVFDPSEMCVYGYNYGYNAYSVEKRLIWDLSESDNDGRDVGFTLDGFEKYSVKLVFDDIKRDAAGTVIVYSLNGRSLSNTVVQDGGPSCYVGTVSGATLGSELELPVPTVYDPIGGTDEFEGSVRLIKPDGTFAAIVADEEELVADEEGYCEFAVGAKATIDAAGEYALEYKAKNAAGKFGSVYNRKFTVASEDIRFELNPGGGYAFSKKAKIYSPRREAGRSTV